MGVAKHRYDGDVLLFVEELWFFLYVFIAYIYYNFKLVVLVFIMNLERAFVVIDGFICCGCGNCCRRAGGYVYVDREEAKNMAYVLGVDLYLFKQKYLIESQGWWHLINGTGGACCFLDKENRCVVYEARPKKCRTYPSWPEIWQSRKSLDEERLLCPALNNI
jgi:uncharacterized protein